MDGSEARVLRLLHHALSDWDEEGSKLVEDDLPCDTCLRGNAPHCGPTGRLPVDEGLFFVDTWHVNVRGFGDATINVVGGYLVTNRMLSMFKKKDTDQPGGQA